MHDNSLNVQSLKNSLILRQSPETYIHKKTKRIYTATKISFMYSFLGIARPRSQFPQPCVCERFIYSQDRFTYFLQQNRQIEFWNIKIAHRHMNVEIRTVFEQFLFWQYLFRIFVIGSLQCNVYLNSRHVFMDSFDSNYWPGQINSWRETACVVRQTRCLN